MLTLVRAVIIRNSLEKSKIITIIRLLEYYNSNKIKNLAMMNLR